MSMTSRKDFGAKTSSEQVMDAFGGLVTGKVGKLKNRGSTSSSNYIQVLITGVSPSGLGAAMAKSLAQCSPSLLILTGRNVSKTNAVAEGITASSPNTKVRTLKIDLSSLDSVAAAAKEVNAYPEPGIDLLINNAGIMNIPERTLSVDGFEMQLATNHLGPFIFTNSIVVKIIHARGRIVNIVSNGHALSPFRFSDYNFDNGKNLPDAEQPPKDTCEAFGVPWELGYVPAIAYGQSKSAGILYTIEMAKRLKGKGVTSICVNPGAAPTELWREWPQETIDKIFSMMPMKTIDQAASTPLVAALDPKLAGTSGLYLDDCQPSEVASFARLLENAEKLWKLSEKLVGKEFKF